ncbi:acyltransferase family protein [Pseudenterobacter timonensis]|uniref:Acyltransferase family protein n=1 Tax=Pseudenterobacter timonensis TaxID=1755099 RepID=A0ABV4A235_9ENTR
MNKIQSIHYLRGIAALLVVAFHLRGLINNAYAQKNLGDLLFFSGPSGVDLFFIISGFIIAYSTAHKSNHARSIFVVKRLFRVYPVYIISLILFCLVIVPNDIQSFIRSSLLIHLDYSKDAPFFGYSLILPAWTLTYELYFYFVFLIAMSISHKYRLIIASGLLLIPMAGLQAYYNGSVELSGFTKLNGNPDIGFIKLLASPMLLEFVYGMFFYWAIDYIKKVPHKNIIFFACVSFAVCAFFARYRFGYGPLNFGLWAFVLFLGCIVYEAGAEIKENRVLNFLGDISYSLYITHGAVNAILIRKLSWLPIYSSGPGFAKMLFACSIFIVVAYITYNFIEKPFIKLGRRFCNRISAV